MLVNTKQNIAVLAVGLAVATTGLVTDRASAASPPAAVSAAHRPADNVAPGETNRKTGGNR